jgi:hypothetical protein
MATIQGPRVEMPASLSQMFDVDDKGNITAIRPEWAQFFHAVQGLTWNMSRSGPTGSRPTSSTGWRYHGMPFMDLTLGYPVFLRSASSNVWVDANGVVR